MKQDFFTNLPSEVIISFLSRLPVRINIIRCKCVCKSWLDLLETDEFFKSHISKSVTGLVILQSKVFKFEDGLDLEHHDPHYNPVTKFDHRVFISRSNADIVIQRSVNGLALLHDLSTRLDAVYICNPFTRDYIEFHCPQEFVYPQECLIYTLGTGSWRSIASDAPFEYKFHCGAFLNGNLHWLVSDLKGSQWISCFDLETELFSTFSSPPALPGSERFLDGLFALGDCLCLCDNSSDMRLLSG